jgi:SAM-dependent methyltransferase
VFDALLPVELRRHSERYWSPVAVSILAARWLAPNSARVIDIGSGAGKFCVIAALVTGAKVVGIEHRPHLVASARELASRFGVADRVEFVHGDLTDLEVRSSDALYLFNPFEENILERDEWLDTSIELSTSKFHEDLDHLQATLVRLGRGATVATYDGFGSGALEGFRLVRSADLRGGRLCFWRKLVHAEAVRHDCGAPRRKRV